MICYIRDLSGQKFINCKKRKCNNDIYMENKNQNLTLTESNYVKIILGLMK